MSQNLFTNNSSSRQTGPLFPPIPSQQSPTNPSSQQPLVNPASTSNVRPTQPSQTITQQTTQQRVPQQSPSLLGRRKQRAIKFKQIYKQIEQYPQEAIKKIEASVEIRRILSVSLEYFDRSAEKTQLYEKEHSKKDNFGFGVEEMREECKNMKSQKIDYFWKVLVEMVSEVCNVNQLLIAQYLSQYLRDKPIYPKKLSIRQFCNGRYIFSPNTNFIDTLYLLSSQQNQKKVCLQSEFFLQIFEQLTTEVYSEYMAMLRIIKYLQTNNRRFFRQVIKKQTCDFYSVMWKKYQYFCQVGIKKELVGEEARKIKIREFFANCKRYGIQAKLRKQKITLAMYISVVLAEVLEEYGNWKRVPIISSLIDPNQAIKFVDEDLQALVRQRAENPVRQYQYIKLSLQLLLKILPICSLSKKVEPRPINMQQRQIQQLRTSINSTKSPYLQPIRFLAWFTTPARRRTVSPTTHLLTQIQERWQRVPKSIQLIMRSQHWGEWVALILDSCENAEDIEGCELLMQQIVKILKVYIEDNIEDFWTEGAFYQFEFIKNFLLAWIHEKGVHPFLPVLTKCLGQESRRLEFAKKTLQLIGFDGIKKQIRDSLMQNLDLSDKHNPSLRFSMFQSYNNTSRNTSFIQSQPTHNPRQSYPQQHLKFLCKLIQNSKQNLSLIQQTIFECEPEYSTGILVCKFLLECLSKLRQYKISSIKCMRYVMKTIDALFQCQDTRAAMLIAISVCFMEEWGENNRGQLFQMIGFVCLKPSASQEFRQCQKLRKIISRHIYNITRVSKYVSEYFPLKQDIHQQSQFIELNTLIMQKNHSAMLDWFNRNSIRLQLRATPWFISLLLTLQAPQLLPTDFQTLRLLILKMPVEKPWVQEFGCQLAVLDVLNKSQIVEVVLSILEPSISHTKNQITKQKIFLFSLTNLKYKELLELHLSSKQTGTLYNENQCYFKIKQKQKNLFKSSRDIVIGNIAGALELIATVLDIRARIYGADGVGECWDIVRNLRLFNQICMFVGEKNSIYHYKVPLPRTIIPTTLQTHTSLQPQPQQSPQPSYISINMLQVLSSYTNFESRHNVPITWHSNKPELQQLTTKSPELLHNHDLTLIQDSSIENCLNLDQNQLTFKSDFTIGIGSIFRILSRIVVTDTGALMLYRCLVYYDYRGLLEMGDWGSGDVRQFGVFVREIVGMLEWVQEVQQVEVIFQFLTLAISNSYYFVQELVQSGLLPRLRRNINNIIQQCEDEKRLNQYNKVGLFALALSQHRDRYREQIESFIKLPTNLMQDMLQCLSNLQPKYSRNQRQSTSSASQKQLAQHMQIYRKQAFCILFKGTLHLSIQLLKLYTPTESTNQIISCLQVLRRLSTTFLTKPPKPDYNYASLFKQRPRNCFVLFDTNNADVCVVVGEAQMRWKGRYKGLAKFVGFVTVLGSQYGYNYQFYGAQVFAKSCYAKFQVKNQAEAHVLSVYRCNYQSSLVDCHELMLMSFLSYVLMIQTTGQLGHLLSFASSDRVLFSTQLPTSHPYLSPSPTSLSPTPLLSQLKHHSRHSLQGPNLFSHTLHQNFSQKSTLLLSLISYLESDHQKQYINDLLLYTITMMLYNIQEYAVLGNQYENKILRLNNFVYDATRVRFACSGGVYASFLAVVLKGLVKRGMEGGYERVQEICQCLQSIITYGTAFSTLPQSPYPQKQPFTQKTIQQNLNILSLCLTHVFQSSSPHSHPNRRSSITICIRIAGLIVERYLSFTSQKNMNNIIICQVTNIMLRNCLAELKGNQEEWDDRRSRAVNGQDDTGLGRIAGMYAGRLIKGLVLGVDSCSKCFILQGLMVAHEYGVDNDIGCCNIVMEYMSSQFSNQSKKTSDIQNYPQPNISRTQPKFRSNTQYHLPQFSQDMWSSICCVFTPNLQKIVEINQMLSLLNSIVSYGLYWTNQKYSHIVEQIFNSMINQNFLTQIIQVYPKGTSNRLLECRVPAQSSWQQILEKVQIEQNQPLRFQQPDFQYRYGHGDSFKDKRNEGKKTNLFEFSIHLQICNSIYYYCEVLTECLQKSQSLKKFYSKILNSRFNNIDQQLWFKVSNTLTSSLIFLRQRCISFIRFYPKTLKKIVPIYNYVRKCPDIGYSSNFLNTLLCSANLMPSNMIESYRNFITDACLSICRCSIKLVQTWRSNDWKQSNSTIEIEGENKIRDKLINQMIKFYREWTSYVTVNEYIEEEQESMMEIQKWFETNNKFGKWD